MGAAYQDRRMLKPEDYEEPACPLCMSSPGNGTGIRPIPQQRIVEKLDEYMSRRDYSGAQRHLLYWLEEARAGGDERGELLVRNELIGHYRKTGQKEEALENVRRVMELIDALDFADTVSCGTTCVNAATACQAFGRYEQAIQLFEQAKTVYESRKDVRGDLLGGLYNNMGLTLTALGRYTQACDCYDKAMEIMGKEPNGSLEQAITCLNRANTVEAQLGPEEGEGLISSLLDQAAELLHDPGLPRDGYYAFVCEKCAPTFSYYGYFLEAEELEKTAQEIYGGTGDGSAFRF